VVFKRPFRFILLCSGFWIMSEMIMIIMGYFSRHRIYTSNQQSFDIQLIFCIPVTLTGWRISGKFDRTCLP